MGYRMSYDIVVKTVLDVPVLQLGCKLELEQWPVEITCRCLPGEPRTRDYPGSPPGVEIISVLFELPLLGWRHLDPPDAIASLMPDIEELALQQLTVELLGRYDSEMDARMQRGRDGN